MKWRRHFSTVIGRYDEKRKKQVDKLTELESSYRKWTLQICLEGHHPKVKWWHCWAVDVPLLQSPSLPVPWRWGPPRRTGSDSPSVWASRRNPIRSRRQPSIADRSSVWWESQSPINEPSQSRHFQLSFDDVPVFTLWPVDSLCLKWTILVGKLWWGQNHQFPNVSCVAINKTILWRSTRRRTLGKILLDSLYNEISWFWRFS